MLDKAKALFRKAISKVAGTHEQKTTIVIDVNLPDHEERTTTSKFLHTKKELLVKVGSKCWICGKTEEESGYPLEAHHWVIEWAFANAVDWNIVKADFPDFPDWDELFSTQNYSLFVDNMLWNGKILCKQHHVGLNAGIHYTTYPNWVIQRYLKEGYQYSTTETIHHSDAK
jgi:hypothetical protein